MSKQILVVLSALLLLGCSSKSDSVNEKSLKSIETYSLKDVHGEEVVIKDSILFSPEDIWVEDSLLVVRMYTNNGFLRIYSKHDGRLIKIFGNMGNASYEYLNPKVFRNAQNEYIISDMKKFTILNISNDGNYTVTSFPLETPLFATNFIAYNVDEIIYNSGSSDDQLCYRNLENDDVKGYRNYPTDAGIKVSDFIANTNVYRSRMVRMEEKIFAAYSFYPILDIIPIDKSMISRSSHSFSSEYNVISLVDSLNAKVSNRCICHVDIDVNRSGIYTLYYGESEENIEKMQLNPQILKYNIEGDLIQRYQLDRFTNKFCVDDTGEVAYILSHNDESESVILRVVL